MIAGNVFIGIDVSRDWLDGFPPSGQRFRLSNSVEGHEQLLEILQTLPATLKVGFETRGGQEWALWKKLARAGVEAVQLPPAQIKAFARSRGTRAKTDRIDAELIAGFIAFRPKAGRKLPDEKLQVLRMLTTRRAQLVGLRKQPVLQIGHGRGKLFQPMSKAWMTTSKRCSTLKFLNLKAGSRVLSYRRKLSSTEQYVYALFLGIGPVSAAMLIAELPELGNMTSGEATAMSDLGPVPCDSGTMRGKRMIAGGRRALRHVLYRAALAAAYHNLVLKSVALRLKECSKPHKLVIVAIARRLVTIANAVLKSGSFWRDQAAT